MAALAALAWRAPLLATCCLAAWQLPVDVQIYRVTYEVRRADLERTTAVERLAVVPMRDGVRLTTDLYIPKGDGPFPAIF